MTSKNVEPLRPLGRGSGTLISPASAARWLIVAIIVAGIYFFHGFLVPVLAALVIAFASWPVFRRLRMALGGNKTVAAIAAILLLLTFIIVPVALAGVYAGNEISEWVKWAVEVNRYGAPPPQWIVGLPLIGEWLSQMWVQHVGPPGALGHLLQIGTGANFGSIYRAVVIAGGGAFTLLLTTIFMLIALFFIFKDGEAFAEQIDRLGERLLPTRWERISRVVPATISSTVTGMTIIAIGEGVVLGGAYWIAGVPSPATLGVITAIMALVPGGAPLCFSLVSLYLVGSGSPLAGLLLFIWGSTELFIVDKTLRPKLVGGPVKLAFLPTFFGLIGGVKTMGFLGLFIGPVLMALLVAIWREWLREIGADERDEPLTADNTALTLNDTNSNIKELSAGYQRKSD
ncbi:AI-2E family transporter [Phyllobacterium brassicacearum]|nr:AI-2E family transporter [Phyllobacterium brassicacearum]TDQ33531.1 putative PurR-regulated permease PerM [Phyllobacterium brassicacearum]